jgi:DNA-binding beta-propeller fold protein YncE
VTDEGTGGLCENGVIGQLGDITLAPDGRSAYGAAAFGPAGVLAFTRNATTGELDQLPGGCYGPAFPPDPECTDVEGVDQVRGVAVSPDGRHVYATGDGESFVAAFTRQTDGSLVRVPGAGGCVTKDGTGGACTTAPRLPTGLSVVVVSPDGRHVYAAGASSSNADAGVTALARNPDTGALSLLPGPAACITEFGGGGCRDGHGIREVSSMVMDPEGESLYVGGKPGPSRVLAILSRDGAGGSLSQSPLADGCYSQEGSFSCLTVDGFTGDGSGLGVTISPDGFFVYAASDGGGGGERQAVVRTFERTPSGALTPLTIPGGCLYDDSASAPPAECAPAPVLDGAANLRATTEGLLYSGSVDDGGVAIAGSLARNEATGVIAPVPPPGGCVANGGALGCAVSPFNFSSNGIATSPNGRSLYVTSFGGTGTSEPGILTLAIEPRPRVQLGSATCAGRLATIVGTPGRDVIAGTRGGDVIAALGGKDAVRGGRGADVVCAGTGNDGVRGGPGGDDLRGVAGRDRLRGDGGRDKLSGGGGKDGLSGGPGNDRANGGPGKDRLKGGPGKDRLKGGGGRDRCNGGGGKDRAGSCERRSAI